MTTVHNYIPGYCEENLQNEESDWLFYTGDMKDKALAAWEKAEVAVAENFSGQKKFGLSDSWAEVKTRLDLLEKYREAGQAWYKAMNEDLEAHREVKRRRYLRWAK